MSSQTCEFRAPTDIEATRTALREGLERARELVDEARWTLEHPADIAARENRAEPETR